MVGVEFAIRCGADVVKYSLGKCKARSRCGDGALAIARCTAHPSGSGDIPSSHAVRYRAQSPATARAHPSSDRCATHFVRGGYFATPASHYPLPTIHYHLPTTNYNRKSKNRKSINHKFHQLSSDFFSKPLCSSSWLC